MSSLGAVPPKSKQTSKSKEEADWLSPLRILPSSPLAVVTLDLMGERSFLSFDGNRRTPTKTGRPGATERSGCCVGCSKGAHRKFVLHVKLRNVNKTIT
jgi:hypothetical protein